MKQIKHLKQFSMITIIVNFFILFGTAFSIEYKELIEKIQQQEQKIEKIKSDYIQLVNLVELKEEYILKASFIYKRPNKIKVYVYEPFRQIIIADNQEIYVKDIDTDTIYKFSTRKYFEGYNYLPSIFSNKSGNYSITDFIKKTGLKFVTEEKNYYVLSTRYAKGKVYTDKKIGLRPGETRFILWLNKETLFPEKVNMISEQYIIETQFTNFQTDFEISDNEFEIEKTTSTKIIEVK